VIGTEGFQRSLGFAGFKIINAGETVTKGFSSFYVLEDAALKAKTRLSSSNMGSDDLASDGDYTTGSDLSYSAGAVIVGAFEEIAVTSGVIIAYFG
jgi:hypothetical protein